MSDPQLLSALADALTLQERHTLWQQRTHKSTSDPAVAQRRVQRWRSHPSLADPSIFQRRLAQAGLSMSAFTHILGWTGHAPQMASQPPQWAEQLSRIHSWRAPDVTTCSSDATADGILAIVAPLVASAQAALQTKLAALSVRFPEVPLPAAGVLQTMFLTDLRRDLERLLLPTVALEVNVARLQGTLAGATPAERFASYLVQFQSPERLRALMMEYPVLFRQAITRIDRWVAVSQEVMERLCHDWDALNATFGAAGALGTVQQIDFPQRSTKRGGRAVVILEFSSGTRLVYKPRSLALEAHFQQLLHWLNSAGFTPTFRLLPLLDRGTYGWMGWVSAQPCYATAELQRFYQRQGALLALLYALEATDLHLSNIIAHGEDPMLIDLEALFHPRDVEPPWPPLELAVDRVLYHSVLRVGLLPEPELGDDEEATPLDLSGLGGAAGQQTPYAVPTWQARHTDAIHLDYQPKRIRGGHNLPTLHGRAVTVTTFAQALDEGFTAMYRFLMANRAALPADDGPLAAFANDEVRVIARPGQAYSQWLDECVHPNLLRNALDRTRFLDHRLWADVKRNPHLAALIPHEQTAISAGDVPLFTTRVASQVLYFGEETVAADFFPQSGLGAAHARLGMLNARDLARQRWFIQATLATTPAARAHLPAKRPLRPIDPPLALPALLLEQACAIGERLATDAICADGEASWVGVTLVANRHWLVEALEDDVEHGLPGVALFLAQLGQRTGEQRWTTLAHASVATIQRYLQEAAEEDDQFTRLSDEPIGILSGVGGILYTFAHLSLLWQDQTLLTAATAQVERMAHRLQLQLSAADEANSTAQGDGTVSLDDVNVAHGLAGLLIGLLALYQVNPTAATRQIAQQVGEQLCTHLNRLPPSLSPQEEAVVEWPFAQFFQHQVGIAWPLLTLAAITGEGTFRSAGAKLLAADPPTTAPPGLWLAYLRALPLLQDARRQATLAAHFRQELPVLLSALGDNDALGHGDLGYLELLHQAAAVCNEPAYQTLAERYAAGMLMRARQSGWRTAVPNGVATPGFLTGLAGIGHGLLRLAAPMRVPALLALAMPKPIVVENAHD